MPGACVPAPAGGVDGATVEKSETLLSEVAATGAAGAAALLPPLSVSLEGQRHGRATASRAMSNGVDDDANGDTADSADAMGLADRLR